MFRLAAEHQIAILKGFLDQFLFHGNMKRNHISHRIVEDGDIFPEVFYSLLQ